MKYHTIRHWLENIKHLQSYLRTSCDALKLGGPLTTRQPTENLYVSYRETHT